MSLIVNRFDYTQLSRTSLDGKRGYKCPDGDAVASVTTILDSTKDKTHLLEWRKRVGEQTAKRITKEASGMGTRMHKYIEKCNRFLKGKAKIFLYCCSSPYMPR